MHQAAGVWALKDKRTRKRDQEEVGGGNNVVMNKEEEEKEWLKEEKGLRAASVWHSQGSRAEAEQKRSSCQLTHLQGRVPRNV